MKSSKTAKFIVLEIFPLHGNTENSEYSEYVVYISATNVRNIYGKTFVGKAKRESFSPRMFWPYT